jgi:hypothetical protein
MKVRYPIFLSKNPTFMGLGFSDLIILGIGLVLSMTFKLDSLVGLIITTLLIGINKTITYFIDLKGLLHSRKIKDIDWMDSINNKGELS